MTKIEEQAYLAGYNGKSKPPWVAKSTPILYKAWQQGKKDRKNGVEIVFKTKTL